MSKHIINTLRKFVLSAAIKALPLRSARLEHPEPLRKPVEPEDSGTWLFAPARSVADHAEGLSHEMRRLAGVLGGLHSVVSAVSSHAPTYAAREASSAFGTLWADELLFDGEPLPVATSEALDMGDAFLFDDTPHHPLPAHYQDVQPRASL